MVFSFLMKAFAKSARRERAELWSAIKITDGIKISQFHEERQLYPRLLCAVAFLPARHIQEPFVRCFETEHFGERWVPVF